MTDHMPDDLSAVGRDMRAYTDELRPRHGVVRNVQGEWVLLRHELVVEAALSDDRFSNAVSSHLQIPNGMDSDEHTAYRDALDRFLTPDALAPFHERFRRVAADLVASLPRDVAVDAVSQVGVRFAVRAQSAWLGWPADLEDRLVAWVAENHAATRSGDKAWTQKVAESFDDLILSVLEPRRAARGDDTDDLTARLMQTEVSGRRLTDAEIVSVLRNWTGGDLGSIAQCVGVLIHYLATHPAVQDHLRAGVPDAEIDAIIDEILRIDDPFLSNRRVTTCPVAIGGVQLPQGARVKLNWTSANRDEATFGNPDSMDPERNADRNLVYGIGKHACPGRWLATLEMRIALQELLAATSSIALDPQQSTERAASPVGGWAKVAVVLA
ncbi:cytochrome P450 [Aromatoleum petrolei]|uniref:Cytochrome P450 n=2 Tax=Aromatoleum petrolei TaxID=76116 RepID=A0ABX1MQ83_9RHOO|nr:cytochrome P450 [Aromatoleum petrolei]NMF89361.1 cytochrome P450 [Aromatoleum petrolei]QTQ39090.1 Cytochrome P450 family protein [Aromatoleum petrolei]